MGEIIGGLVGGIGSLIGGNAGEGDALKGYNYLTSGGGANATQDFVHNGRMANDAEAQLLGLSPITGQTTNGFNNYLNSTGYKFQLGQGTGAITGSAAARGLLNSGGDAKALMQFGQGLAGQSFNNYLGQLHGLGDSAQTSLRDVSQAGTVGGGNAGQIAQSGISSGFGQLGSAAGSLFNVFGGL